MNKPSFTLGLDYGTNSVRALLVQTSKGREIASIVWQYSHHVRAGLFTHRGPILTGANWSGRWPGLVGMLNGSMTKTGAPLAWFAIGKTL